MTDQVTSLKAWNHKPENYNPKPCWNCKIGTYVVYDSDITKTPRCGQCGELERDDPAKTKSATTSRRTAKAKEKA